MTFHPLPLPRPDDVGEPCACGHIHGGQQHLFDPTPYVCPEGSPTAE